MGNTNKSSSQGKNTKHAEKFLAAEKAAENSSETAKPITYQEIQQQQQSNYTNDNNNDDSPYSNKPIVKYYDNSTNSSSTTTKPPKANDDDECEETTKNEESSSTSTSTNNKFLLEQQQITRPLLLKDPELIRTLPRKHNQSVRNVVASVDNKFIATVSEESGGIILRYGGSNPEKVGDVISQIPEVFPAGYFIMPVALSNRLLATVGKPSTGGFGGGFLHFWQLPEIPDEAFSRSKNTKNISDFHAPFSTTEILKIKNPHSGSVESCSLSSDDTRFLVCSRDKTATVWNISSIFYGTEGNNNNNNAPLHTLKHSAELYAGSFSVDGKVVVTGDCDGRLVSHNAVTGAKIKEIEAHESKIWYLVFLKKGNQFVASCSTSSTARIHNVLTGTVCIDIHISGWARGIGISSNDKILGITSNDKTFALYDTANGNRLCAPVGPENGGHDKSVYHVVLLDNTLVTGSEDKETKVFTFDVSRWQLRVRSFWIRELGIVGQSKMKNAMDIWRVCALTALFL